MKRAWAALLLGLIYSAAQAAPVLLPPERVWTGAGQPHQGWAVLVDKGKIEGAGPADKITVPAGAERIQLPGKTLLPEMMDLHSHHCSILITKPRGTTRS